MSIVDAINVISILIDKVIGIVCLVITYLQYKKDDSPESSDTSEPQSTEEHQF